MTLRLTLAILISAFATTASLAATTLTWTGAGDNKTFSSASNWSPAMTPDATTDCVIPAGAAVIQFGGVSTVRSLTVARDITLNSCNYLTLTNGLVIQAGVTVTLDQSSGCIALAFSGGPQSISGNGTVFLKNSGIGNPSSLLNVYNGADLRIESGITVRIGPGTGKILIGVNTGCRLTNAGLLTLPTSKSLSIVGSGFFENSGTIQAIASRIELLTPTWLNSGTISLNSGTVMLGGTYTSWGNITKTGASLIELAGRYLTTQVQASSATGDLALAGVELTNATISSIDGARVVSKNVSTLDGCTVLSDLEINCGTWIIRNNLTLNSKLTIRSISSCGDTLRFEGATQSLAGNGRIELLDTATLKIAVDPGCDATLSESIPVLCNASAGKVSSVFATIASGATFRLRTPLTLQGGTLSIAGAGKFINETQLNMPTGGTMVIAGTPWENTGTIAAVDATVTLGGAYSTFANFSRLGGSLTLSGSYSGALLETVPTIGPVLLRNFSASNAVLLPSGGSTITIAESVALQACTLAGPAQISSCGSLTITSGLTFANSARLTVARTPNNCPSDAIQFSGGIQLLSGTGDIFLTTDDPAAVHLTNSAVVTIGPGVALRRGSGSNGVLGVTIDAGCRLINQGLIESSSAGSTLSFQGAGALENSGIIDISAGTIKLLNSSWSSTGQVKLAGAGSLVLQGSPAWLASIEKNGGTVSLTGLTSGGVVETNDAIGDIAIDSVTLTGTTLRTTGAAKFIFSGHNEKILDACTVDGTIEIINGAELKVRNNLELLAGSNVNIYTATSGTGTPKLTFQNAAQLLKGTGTINAGSGVIATTMPLQIEPGIVIQTVARGIGNSISFAIGASGPLVNYGTIRNNSPERYLYSESGSASKFDNRGVFETSSSITWRVKEWANSGIIRCSTGADFYLQGAFSNPGTIEKTGGRLTLAGQCTAVSLDCSAMGGDVLLRDLSCTGTVLTGSAAGRPVLRDEVTLDACIFSGEIAVSTECSNVRITNGLSLASAYVTFLNDGNCGPASTFHLFGSPQTIDGTGTIEIRGLTFVAEGPATLGPGVELLSQSTVSLSTDQIGHSSGSSLTSYATITMNRAQATMNLGGTAFVNLGKIRVLAGTINLTTNGSMGDVTVAPGGKLSVSGNYSIDAPLNIGPGGSLSLGGTWTNNSIVSVTDAPLTLGGTWTNAGTITALNSSITIGGTPVQEGNLQFTNSPRTYTGTYKGSLIAATPETGDIKLSSATLTGTTLRTSGGARFIFQGSSNTFNSCTIENDLTFDLCNSLNVNDALTLVGGARLIFSGCSSTPLILSGATTTVSGTGGLVFRGTAPVVTVQLLGVANAIFSEGISVSFPADATTSTLRFATSPSGTIVLRGLLSLERPFGSTAFQAGFSNQGVIDLRSGSLAITNLLGPIGNIAIAPGASLVVDGTYTINQDLAFSNGGSLSLAGTWSNSAQISMDGGPLTLGGTWTNSGSLHVANSLWTIGGTYSSLGSYTSSGNSLAYAGNYPFPSLIADASTGDILLLNINLKNARLEARDAARLVVGAGSTLGLDNCTIASDLTLNSCSAATISNGLTLENNATLILKNRTCTKTSLAFTGPEQTIGGTGRILIADPASVADFQVAGTCLKVNIGSGVSLVCKPPAGGPNASISVSGGRTLTNRGLISCQFSGTFSITGTGTFSNEATVESVSGTFSINPTTISNYTAPNSTLSGGTWRAINGSLTLGTRSIVQLAPNTTLRLQGASITTPTLAQLSQNAGTLSLQGRTLITSAPFTNTGILELNPGSAIDAAAGITLSPSGTVRLNLGSPQAAAIRAGSSLVLGGSLSVGVLSGPVPEPGSLLASFASADAISGSFASACFDPNPQSIGVSVLLNPPTGLPPQATLDLLFNTDGGTSPSIQTQPSNTSAQPDAHFSVAAAPVLVQYRWRRNLVPLTDGPTGSGSTIVGSETADLSVLSAHASDAGFYDCVVSNACGSTISQAAELRVCPGDLNADGFVDDSDFIVFVAAYNILDCADPGMAVGCPADLDLSGAVDDADFVIFLGAYNQLLCP
ncbi:MAG: hypothetical protein JNM86_02830 [Phycisphaerae bacterium]|nr:hypothetical protein [Phycisphaerae bacterium]